MNFLYRQTISSYPQLQYGKKPHDISIYILHLWTINIKELIWMGVQNKKLYIQFCYKCNFESSTNSQVWYGIKN
jgi:hypothetical protein